MSSKRKLKSFNKVLLLFLVIHVCCGNILAEGKYSVEVKDFFNTLPNKTCVWKIPINGAFSIEDRPFISVKKNFGENNTDSGNQLLTLSSSIYINDTSYFYYIPYKEKPVGPLILVAPDNQEYYGAEINLPIVTSPEDSIQLDIIINEYSNTFTDYRKLIQEETKYKKKLGNKIAAPLIVGILTIVQLYWESEPDVIKYPSFGLSVAVIVNYFYNLFNHLKRIDILEDISYELNNWNYINKNK